MSDIPILLANGKFRDQQRQSEALHGRCDHCKWSAPAGTGVLACQRHPPQATILMVPCPPPRVGQMMPQSFAGFPLVQPDMWCGEFVRAGVVA